MKKESIESALMSLEDAATYLDVSRESLYQKARAGIVPSFKLGSHWKFNKDALDRWIKCQVENKD